MFLRKRPKSSCASAPEAPPSFLSSLKSGFVTTVLVLLGAASVMLAVIVAAWRNWVVCHQASATCQALQSSGFMGLAVAVFGAVPLFLPVLIALVNDGTLIARTEFTIPALRISGVFEPSRGPSVAALHEVALRHWNYHETQAYAIRDRRLRHAHFYATITTFLLSVLGATLMFDTGWANGGEVTALMQVVVAIFSAVVARFLLDFGNMLVRSAQRDSSSRMFACGAYHLMTTVFAAGLLRALAWLNESAGTLDPVVLSVVLGVLAAGLGERVLKVAMERFGKLFGVEPTPRSNGLTLTFLDGLDAAEEARLQEEGIDSIHALAFASVPKLFFRTPFGLGQICDWQDQAILITRLGEERAVQFRKQLGICMASELALLARQYLDSDAREQEETAAQLNLGNRLSVHTTLTRFASDESIALLALYRLASPKNADFAAGRADEPLRSQTFLGSAAQ